MKGLKSFAEEYTTKQLILISLDAYPRKVGEILVMPWHIFLDKLWSDEIME
ncbi:MAG: hypothetical protein K9I68_02120 [Bacteroidales bacterium]|nr:hypothetical protein [Bacteroidales bacterium]